MNIFLELQNGRFSNFLFSFKSESYLKLFLLLVLLFCGEAETMLTNNQQVHSCLYFPLQSIITPDKFALSKCFIPQESTVIAAYIIAGILFTLMILRPAYQCLRSHRKYRLFIYNSCIR